jgi:hypothetical protein
MKTSLVLLTVFIVVLLSISLVLANPTMLPKHPGYPMGKAVDPVSGQSLANDPGQANATGENSLAQASAFDDVHVISGCWRSLEQGCYQKFRDPTSRSSRL